MPDAIRTIPRRALLGAAAALCAAAGAARAQGQGAAPAFPTRPLRFIVPYPPGGGGDTVARLIAPGMAETLGQPVVVENRGGAGGSIGAAAVAQAAPDGYTFLLDAMGHIVNPLVLRGLAFDYARAFAPIGLIVFQPQILAVPATSPARTVADLVALMRARPGGLSFGSSGNATGPHLASELFLLRAGARAVHVPYRGGAPALADLMAGSIDFLFGTAGTLTGVAREGRIRALAVSSARRVAALPAVPTMQEAGIADYVFDEWNGLFAPAGTPPAILARLHRAMAAALAQPSVRERMATIGIVPAGDGPEPFAAFLARQRAVVAEVVEKAQVVAQ